MMKKKRTLAFFLTLVCFSWGYSQSLSPEVTASAGDHFTGADVQLSWTLGELMIETYDNGTNQLTQGFHQTNLMITAVEDLAETIEIEVFPNPVADQLTIECSDNSEDLTFTVYDIMGKQLLSEEDFNKNGLINTIDLTTFSAGTYLLHLSNAENKTIKTFKIIKNK